MTTIWTSLATRARAVEREDGATAVEYGLMVALIAGVIITAVIFTGGRVVEMYNSATGW